MINAGVVEVKRRISIARIQIILQPTHPTMTACMYAILSLHKGLECRQVGLAEQGCNVLILEGYVREVRSEVTSDAAGVIFECISDLRRSKGPKVAGRMNKGAILKAATAGAGLNHIFGGRNGREGQDGSIVNNGFAVTANGAWAAGK